MDCSAVTWVRDAFVLDIVARVSAELPGLDSEFVLYGHSAGGQFRLPFRVDAPRARPAR